MLEDDWDGQSKKEMFNGGFHWYGESVWYSE